MKQKGYDVQVVGNGEDALTRCRASSRPTSCCST